MYVALASSSVAPHSNASMAVTRDSCAGRADAALDNTCSAARSLAEVAGDQDGTISRARGTRSEWLKVKGTRPQFRNRKKARNYCRNHYGAMPPNRGIVIVHPDGNKEEFTYDGPVLARALGQ